MKENTLKLIISNNLTLGLLVAFDFLIVISTGLTIQSLESDGKIILVIILIALLLSFNYLYINRNKNRINIDNDLNFQNKTIEERTLLLNLNGKMYSFSGISVIILIFFCPILSFFIFLFFNLKINNWLQELMAKQTAFLLNVIFNINTKVLYVPQDEYPWIIYLYRNRSTYRISNQCTGTHVFSIFISIIICTPSSNSLGTLKKKDMIWRKYKIFIASLIVLYSFNLIRMTLLIYLDFSGFSFTDIHGLINNLSGIFAALLFVIFLWNWLPEFFISLYYIYLFVKNKYYN